jgi:hypothetical protein
MQKKGLLCLAPIVALALAAACGGNDKQPVSPSPSASASLARGNATSDAVTLKANAPTLVSPIGGVRLTTGQVTLTFQAATAKYVTGESFSYRVQLLDASSNVLEEKTGTATSYTMSTQFATDTLYRWRARAEQSGLAGPWSATESFRSMEKPTGYIRNDEVYDPLTDGKSVGILNGSVQFVAEGALLPDFYSNIEYHIPQTIYRGEYSAIMTGLTQTSGGKTKVMSMGECPNGCTQFGSDNIVENDRRMTVEKRSDNTVAWRFITHDDQVDTEGAERVFVNFRKANTYFFRATWDGAFRVQIFEGGINGAKIYDFGKNYDGRDYDPLPHWAWAGAPIGRSGPDAATAPGMTIRQVWISSNPRPSWAQ